MHKHEFQVLADTIGRGTVSHIPQRYHVHESLGKIDLSLCVVVVLPLLSIRLAYCGVSIFLAFR